MKTGFKGNLQFCEPSKEIEVRDSGVRLEWTQAWRPGKFNEFLDNREIGLAKAKMWKNPETAHDLK